jgi:murein DD-endopeptidase MepM/ murein hydrolase activator NlpD
MEKNTIKIIQIFPYIVTLTFVGLFLVLVVKLEALDVAKFLLFKKPEDKTASVSKNIQNLEVFEAGKVFGVEKIELPQNTNFLAFSGDQDLDGHAKNIEHENIATIEDKTIYVVQKGESVSEIAKYFGVSIESITTTNRIVNGKVKKGDTLDIPQVSGIAYVIKKGDTLEKIIKMYNVDLDEVLLYNNLFADDAISVDDEIYLPGAKPIKEVTKVSNKSIAKNTKKRWEKGDTSHLNTQTSITRYLSLPKFLNYFTHPSPGATRTQKLHGANSVDLANTKGAPVVASAEGIIRIAKSDGYNYGYGKYIVIKHPNGTETLYAHNSEVLVVAGQVVSRGQQIAKIGSTGNSTGPHVHFEIKGAYNPFAW